MPKADATGLAPEKSAEQNPPALSSAPEGFLLCAASPISMVKSRSGGLGHSNAKTARMALQILRLLGPGGIPPKPIAKLRNSPGNNVRISGGKSVTRYSERGKDYNHSTYCDLIITGLAGLRTRADEVIEVKPLVPDGTWDYFCLDNVLYHGRTLTILYDKSGNRYKKGKGLRVLANGKQVGVR